MDSNLLFKMQEHESWVKSDDGTADDAVWTREWNEELDRASLAFGKRWNVAEEQLKWIKDAGFEDVQEFIYKVVFQHRITLDQGD
jgi:hypothetical protein